MPVWMGFVVGLGFVVVAGVVAFFVARKKDLEAQVLAAQAELSRRSQGMDPLVAAQIREATTQAFQGLQTQLMELNRQSLKQESELQKKEVQVLVRPLESALQTLQKNLQESEAHRNKEFGSLGQLMRSVVETQTALKTETQSLVSALKRPSVRGRWGEVQLKRIVELAGMNEHVDFAEQATGDDARLRPDMLIHLPNGRKIIVDSKAVLNGYLEAEEAKDEATREAALLRHSASLKTRVQELARKSYWEQFPEAPEFVVLFVPGEAFFSAALEKDPELVEFGFSNRVVLATPTTLMALLRAVAFGWRQEQVADNARRISDQASKLYQSLSVWSSHLSKVGESLDRATKTYNQSIGSLERSVLPSVRKLKELGVSSKDEWTELASLETGIRSASVGPQTDALPDPSLKSD
jgi:DNA recombination protein RmuC